MALTPGLNHALYAQIFSRDTILTRQSLGELNQDDVDFIFQLQVDVVATTDDIVGIVGNVVSSLVVDIEGNIDQGVADPSGVVDNIEAVVKNAIREALTPIFDAIAAITEKIKTAVTGSLDGILGVVKSVGLKVTSGISDVLEQAKRLTDKVKDDILTPISQTLTRVFLLIKDITVKVVDALDSAIAPIIATTTSILDSVQGFATAIREAFPAFGVQLLDGLVNPMALLTGGIKEAAGSILNSFFGDIAEDAVERIEPLIKMFEDELSVNPELRKITAPGILPVAAIGGLIAGFALPMILSSVASTALSPFAEKMRQRMASLVRPSLVGATDALQGVQRGFMSQDLADNILDRHGFPDDQVASLVQLIKTRPGTMDIIDYWRREILNDAEADKELQNLGWDGRYRVILKEAAFPPPGVSDLIRMAVREVFSPEVAEAFGQFQEIPDQYLIWAKRVGLSEEWARNFWAAHWVLPSVQQGFEMLHRSVITSEDLERLFVALDVMPFWRQPLKDISFRPYTRVDVRHMFSLGILDRSGVLRAYLDLGFDPEKAENMTEFTVRWVESTRKVEKDRERDLTKSDILGLFNDGLLTEEIATAHLRTMGYDDNEADLLIGREILQELRRDRKADIALVVDQAKIKVLTFSEAQDKLNGLDLTRKEMERALIEVSRATTERVRLPSKSDLDGWKELNLISLVQYETELDNLGFPAKYVALYVEAIQLEEAEDLLAAEERAARAAEPRPVTKGQLDSLLRTDIIDIDQYTTGLETLGFSERAIADFTVQITFQIEERRLEDEERRARGEEAAEKEKPLGRVLLGKLLLKEIIGFDAYQTGLQTLGFSVESVALLMRLMREKLAAEDEGS